MHHGNRPVSMSSGERHQILQDILTRCKAGQVPGSDLEILFKSWFASDADEAVSTIMALEDEDLKFSALLQALEVYAADGARLAALCEQVLASDDMRRKYVYKCLQFLAINNPETAWYLLDHPAFFKFRQDNIKTLFGVFGNPESGWTATLALDATRHLRSQHEIDCGLRQMVRGVAGMGISDYRAIFKLSQDENVRSQAFLNLTRRALADQEMEIYLKSITSLPTSEMGRRMALGACLTWQGAGSLDDRLAKLRGSTLWRVGADDAMVAGVITEDISPLEGMRFANTVDDSSPQAPQVFRKVADQLVRRDANDCAKWILTLPSGPIRNAAIEPLLKYLRQNDERESIKQWEALISK